MAASHSGRPKTSPVWDYFQFDSHSGKTICQVSVEDKICNAEFKGKYTTNLKVHLKSKHPHQHEELLQKEKEVGKKKDTNSKRSFKGQKKLTEIFRKKEKYGKDHKQITMKLAVFVASTSTPNSIVENTAFVSLVEELDSQYPVPSRYVLGKQIDEVMIALKENIQAYMSMARRINLCTDIWSKKGMTASFLGVTVHFFACDQRHNATIAVKRMPTPHTAENILEVVVDVLTDWNIPGERVGNTITDNGSNMIKAFKEDQHPTDLEVDDENTSTSKNQEAAGDVEEDTDQDDSSDDELDEDDSRAREAKIDQDTEEFDSKETDHQIAFADYRRISCFAHSLQLVVTHFDKVSPFQRVIRKAKKLVAKFNKSTKATEKLIALAHKKLISDCPTRWSSSFLLFKRLLEVRESVGQVLTELEWNGLQASEWKKLESIVVLLESFAQYTTLCCGEEYTTLSTVVPIIMELNCHLTEMETKPGMRTVTRILQQEMHRRFDRYIRPPLDARDALYVVATLLDPEYSLILTSEQVAEGVVHLKQLVINFLDTQQSSTRHTKEAQETTTTDREVEPPLKKFRHLSKIVSQQVQKEHNTSTLTPAEEEVDQSLCNEKATIKEKSSIHWISG